MFGLKYTVLYNEVIHFFLQTLEETEDKSESYDCPCIPATVDDFESSPVYIKEMILLDGKVQLVCEHGLLFNIETQSLYDLVEFADSLESV